MCCGGRRSWLGPLLLILVVSRMFRRLQLALSSVMISLVLCSFFPLLGCRSCFFIQFRNFDSHCRGEIVERVVWADRRVEPRVVVFLYLPL